MTTCTAAATFTPAVEWGESAPFGDHTTPTLPLHVAQAWWLLTNTPAPDPLPLVPRGYRWEVSLSDLPTRDAEQVSRWFSHVKDWWRTTDPSQRETGALTRRIAVEYRETASSHNRSDLGTLFPDLELLPGVGDVLSAVTAAQPDWSVVDSVCRLRGGSLTRTSDTVTLVTLPTPLATLVPPSLGGMAMLGHHQRLLHLTLNHAAWRSRRSRRLTRVQVEVVDRWPDPRDLPSTV